MQDQELCTTSRAGQGTAMSDAIQRDVWAISTKLSARDRYQPVTRREWKDTGGSQPAALVPLAPVPPSVNRARRSLCMWSPNSKQQDGTGILLGPGQILLSRRPPRLPSPSLLLSPHLSLSAAPPLLHPLATALGQFRLSELGLGKVCVGAFGGKE